MSDDLGGNTILLTDEKRANLQDVLKGDDVWRLVDDPRAVNTLREEFGEFIGSDLQALYANSWGYFGNGEQRSFLPRACNIIVLSKPSNFYIYEKFAGDSEIKFNSEGAYRMVDEFKDGRYLGTKNFYYVGFKRGEHTHSPVHPTYLSTRDLSRIDKQKVCYAHKDLDRKYMKRHLSDAHSAFHDDRIRKEFGQVFE
ncbi:MAG TPA: hypothetical protein VI968_02395 [archaeon]|nr:hypothetical protein [archaeon]